MQKRSAVPAYTLSPLETGHWRFMETPTPTRTHTALYWLAWSLKECDGMPLDMIAKRLGKSSTEILEILLTHPGRSHAPLPRAL